MADTRDAEIKLRWAEHRLIELKALIAEYRATDPYEMRRSVEGQRKRVWWRLRITSPLPPEIALILGEFVYNVRAALDYIAADLVKPSRRSNSFYPFLNERIWEVPIGDDDSEERRADDRRRWAFIVREMPAAAVEVIKTYHPPNGRPKRTEPMYNLSVLNALSNKDRHRNINVVIAGLDHAGLTVTYIRRDGTTETAHETPLPANRAGVRRTYADGAAVRSKPGVVDVKIKGTVVVSVEVSKEWASIRIPDDLDGLLTDARKIVALLAPLVPTER